eukprot:TRINITY_DN47225_c0_g1_i1.p1 TRINITY_DN47225_c0_g1~~TRINITY_DN47225_c0_g1_i1.p1  ORF type:complete len:497 (+),score=38.21 TRINITY_DN47225_c0_g1_i1:22-1491(+)
MRERQSQRCYEKVYRRPSSRECFRTVRFQVSVHTQPGERVFVYGTGPLGGWTTQKAVELFTGNSSYPLWQSDRSFLYEQEDLKYKYVIRRGDSLEWEQGSDRTLTMDREGDVFDGWVIRDKHGIDVDQLRTELFENVKTQVQNEMRALVHRSGSTISRGDTNVSEKLMPSTEAAKADSWFQFPWVREEVFRFAMQSCEDEMKKLHDYVNGVASTLREQMSECENRVGRDITHMKNVAKDTHNSVLLSLQKLQEQANETDRHFRSLNDEMRAARRDLEDVRDVVTATPAVTKSEQGTVSLDSPAFVGNEIQPPVPRSKRCTQETLSGEESRTETTPPSPRAFSTSETTLPRAEPDHVSASADAPRCGHADRTSCHSDTYSASEVEQVKTGKDHVDAGEEHARPFFSVPPHPEDGRSLSMTLRVERDILESLRRDDTADEKRNLLRSLCLRVHPDKGGSNEAAMWFNAWKESHLKWFMGKGWDDALDQFSQ